MISAAGDIRGRRESKLGTFDMDTALERRREAGRQRKAKEEERLAAAAELKRRQAGPAVVENVTRLGRLNGSPSGIPDSEPAVDSLASSCFRKIFQAELTY